MSNFSTSPADKLSLLIKSLLFFFSQGDKRIKMSQPHSIQIKCRDPQFVAAATNFTCRARINFFWCNWDTNFTRDCIIDWDRSQTSLWSRTFATK